MKDLKLFNIPFVGLKQGSHLFEYEIDKTFFEAFDFNDFNNSKVYVSLNFEKKSTLLNLHFKIEGYVNVDCDVSLESYDQPVSGNFSLIVKFGPEFNDDNEEILVLPYEEYQINVSQYIYELIVLSVPTKRVHPKVVDGTMKSEAMEKLESLQVEDENKDINNVDPRWDKLKGLITEKNT